MNTNNYIRIFIYILFIIFSILYTGCSPKQSKLLSYEVESNLKLSDIKNYFANISKEKHVEILLNDYKKLKFYYPLSFYKNIKKCRSRKLKAIAISDDLYLFSYYKPKNYRILSFKIKNEEHIKDFLYVKNMYKLSDISELELVDIINKNNSLYFIYKNKNKIDYLDFAECYIDMDKEKINIISYNLYFYYKDKKIKQELLKDICNKDKNICSKIIKGLKFYNIQINN